MYEPGLRYVRQQPCQQACGAHRFHEPAVKTPERLRTQRPPLGRREKDEQAFCSATSCRLRDFSCRHFTEGAIDENRIARRTLLVEPRKRLGFAAGIDYIRL